MINSKSPQKPSIPHILILVGIIFVFIGFANLTQIKLFPGSDFVMRSIGQFLLTAGVLLLAQPKLSNLWVWPASFVIAGIFFLLPIPSRMPTSLSKFPVQPTAIQMITSEALPTIVNFSACDALPGLIGRWSGEGDARDSIGSNDGTLKGVAFVPGKVGQGFSLDGLNNYVEIPNVPYLDGMSELTVGAWVKFDNLSANKQQIIVSKAEIIGFGTNSYSIWFAGDTMQLQAAIESPDQLETLIIPDEIETSRFYYIVLTYDGVTFKLYLDGVLKDSVSFHGNILDTAYPLFIGKRSGWGVDGRGDLLDGIVDEVEIYNRALSNSEIWAIFEASSTSNCPDLVEPATINSLFSEQFTTSEWSKKWSALEEIGLISASNGILSLAGGEHKRIDTFQTFIPTATGISAKARILFNGDYQKFGFNVNYGDGGSPTSGIYFDTLERLAPESPGHENAVRLLMIEFPTGQSQPVFVFNQEVPVTWNEYHDFEIAWTTSTISFYIDDELKATVPYTITQALPVGIWNDRAQLMQVDWVEVTEVK
jgi:hypothetical protein